MNKAYEPLLNIQVAPDEIIALNALLHLYIKTYERRADLTESEALTLSLIKAFDERLRSQGPQWMQPSGQGGPSWKP
jgi:hypothetical protein